MGSFFEPDSELGCHGKANFVGRFRRADFDVVVEHDENGFRRSELPADTAGPQMSMCWAIRSSGATASDSTTCSRTKWPGCSRPAGPQPRPDRRRHGPGVLAIPETCRLDRLRPGDTVVLVFFNNDFGDNVGQHSRAACTPRSTTGRSASSPPPHPLRAMRQWKNWMKDMSCLFNLVTYCMDRFQDVRTRRTSGDRVTRRMPSPEQIRADTGDSSPAVQITRHYLSELKMPAVQSRSASSPPTCPARPSWARTT